MMPDVSGYDVLGAISKSIRILDAWCDLGGGSRQIEKVDPTIVRATLRKPLDIFELVAAARLCIDGDQRAVTA